MRVRNVGSGCPSETAPNIHHLSLRPAGGTRKRAENRELPGALGGAVGARRPLHGNGVPTMEKLTQAEQLFLDLLRRLNEQQQQDLKRFMEAFAKSGR